MPHDVRNKKRREKPRQSATPLDGRVSLSGDVTMAPRILVVDDDDEARAMYADYLAWRGYRVQRANDGAAAIACVAASPPDAIVIDLAMAVMDGLSTVRWLRSDERTCHTPTIVLTAAGPDAYADAKAAGCDVFLSKPCTPDALESVLEAVLHGKKAR